MMKDDFRPLHTKTWPWLLLALGVLFVLFLQGDPAGQILRYDREWSLALNQLLGRNILLDYTVGGLNSQSGDKIVILIMMAILTIHIWISPSHEELARRLAFWCWTTLLFLAIYQGQRLVEEAFHRDSPGKVLDGWINLKRLYDISVKTQNTHSFPSGHATAYYFFALVALRRYRLLSMLLLALALVMPTTRVMTGAHWPSDIILGSVPLALLFSTFAFETRLYRIYLFLLVVSRGLVLACVNRHVRSLRSRIQAAWLEFIADHDHARRSDGPATPDGGT